jgi:uncharacterized protein YciI
MPYLIYAIDLPDMEQKRESVRQAHRDFLQSYGAKILASGALLDEDGKTIIGGISLLDTNNRAEAERFADNDPYAKAGIRAQTCIHNWRKRWWNGLFLGDS